MKKKSLLMTIAAVASIGAIAIGSTLAYFTASDSAANTFTLGSIDAHLEEVYGYDSEMEMDLAYTTFADSVDDYTMLFPDTFGDLMSATFDDDLLPTETVMKAPYTVLDGNSNDGFVIMSVAIPMSDINDANVLIQEDVDTVIDGTLNPQPLFDMVDVDLTNWTCIVPDAITGDYVAVVGVEGTVDGSYMVYVFAYNMALTQADPETSHLFEAVQFANVIEGSTLSSNDDLTIFVNTYVIQTEGFADAIEAFNGTAAESYLADLDYNGN